MAAVYEVVLDSDSFAMPARCASCLADATARLPITRRQRARHRTIAIPYCARCVERVRAVRRRERRLVWASLVVAVAAGAAGFAAPGLPLAVLVTGAAGAAVGFGVLAMTWLAPRATADGPAGDAVTLRSFAGFHTRVACANAAWATELATANRLAVRARRRPIWFAARALVIGPLVAPVAALVVYLVAHPLVRIDNAGSGPLQIWIDGVAAAIVPVDAFPPVRVRVAYGAHTFGYAPVGTSRPVAARAVAIGLRHDHLYNPGKTACYRLVRDTYGDATAEPGGRLPPEELYVLPSIDTWFDRNPDSVRVHATDGGATRTAIERAACATGDAGAAR